MVPLVSSEEGVIMFSLVVLYVDKAIVCSQ
jgi:hypothetical protein